MKITKEQMAEISNFSELQFSPAECAVIIGIDPAEFSANVAGGEGDIFNAYEGGRLRAVAEVRRSILQQAKQGSSPAQKQICELMAQLDERLIMINVEHKRSNR